MVRGAGLSVIFVDSTVRHGHHSASSIASIQRLVDMRPCILILFMQLTLCACREPVTSLTGTESTPPTEWRLDGDKYPCLLELNRDKRPVIRINCFSIEGVLHTHSNRFVQVIDLFTESWVYTVARDNRVRVQVDGRTYALLAVPVNDDRRREIILKARGYDPIPDGIKVFRLLGRDP